MVKAKDIMKKDVITVKRNTPIQEAIKILVDNKITGLPVVNDDMTLVGIISEKDILRILANMDLLMVLDDIKKSDVTVEDFMTKDVVAFEQYDTLSDVCDCLIKKNFRRVPILSDGEVVGIISRRDLVKYISGPAI